jgi:hypothetical protein
MHSSKAALPLRILAIELVRCNRAAACWESIEGRGRDGRAAKRRTFEVQDEPAVPEGAVSLQRVQVRLLPVVGDRLRLACDLKKCAFRSPFRRRTLRGTRCADYLMGELIQIFLGLGVGWILF